ncbi:MAG: PAS domain S-box protein [Thermodesulfobacteriota bacterium]
MVETRIMIVEDEFLVAKDLETRLEDAGYSVCASADTGQEAIRLAQQARPDLVLMDIVLRGPVDGIEAAARIRSELGLPVIFVTAHLDESRLERAKVTEAFGYLPKPFQDRELIVAIEMALYKTRMEARLKESEERYRQIFEASRAVMLLVDPENGALVDANSAACRFYGYSREEITRKRTLDIEVLPALDLYSSAGGPASAESGHFLARHRVASGEIRDVEIYAGFVKTDDRTLLHAIVHDVTERMKAERAIKASEERLRAMYKSFPLATFIWQRIGQDYLLVDYNRAGEDLTEGRIGRQLGVKASRFFKHHPEVLADFDLCCRERTVILREMPFTLITTGKEKHLVVTFAYVPPDLVLAHLEDISERKQAENELRTSEERFRTIADFTYDWESWRGPDGRFIWVSPSCERITGYTPQEFYQDPDLFFAITHPEDRPVVESFLGREADSDKFYHLDFRIVRKDGQVRWISHNGQPVYGADGSWQGRRSSNRDVTGRKEAEERLLAYQRQLRTLASELSLAEERERRRIAVDLHDRVGHTLAMCQIKLNQLQTWAASTDMSHALEDVDQLIEASITDIRTLIMEISPPALYELGLEAALDDLAHEIQDQHGLLTEFVDDGRPKPLGADAKIALYRAARELMLNVVKHARTDKMRVTLTADSGRIIIEVSDNGAGFHMEKVAAYDSKTRSFGLFNVRERMSHLGGEVRIESRPGKGTKVTLIAPLEKEPGQETTPPSAKKMARRF